MSDLRPIHTGSPIDPGNGGKITAGIIVVLAIILIAGYTYHQGDWSFTVKPLYAVSDSQLPQALPPLDLHQPAKG